MTRRSGLNRGESQGELPRLSVVDVSEAERDLSHCETFPWKKEEKKMAKRLNRRSFLRLSAVSAGTGVLVACVAPAGAPDSSGASMAEEPIEIRLAEGSWVGPEGIAFWTDEIIPSFEEGHPGI